jgi:hypothetical protein
MSKKERYFQTTKPKQYTDLITKEFKQLEEGSIITLSFINNDLKIPYSNAFLLNVIHGFKELKNYEVLQNIEPSTSFVGDEEYEAPTPEEIEEVQTRKQILSIKSTDKKNAKYLQFADKPMYPSEFIEQIGQEKYDEFVKNGKITPVSFS